MITDVNNTFIETQQVCREVQIGGVLPIVANTGRLRRKGYLFQASRIWKDRDFTRWSIWKGWEICHFSL